MHIGMLSHDELLCLSFSVITGLVRDDNLHNTPCWIWLLSQLRQTYSTFNTSKLNHIRSFRIIIL